MMRRLLSIRPSALLTILFTGLLLIIAVINRSTLAQPWLLSLIYLSIMTGQVVLLEIRERDTFTEYAADIVFPVLAVLTIFLSLGGLVHYINPNDIDSSLIRIDYLITGGYPTIYLERFIHPVLTELLQLSYASYYFMPIILGVALKINRQNGSFDRALFVILLCFYLSYIGYLFFPALGPRYTMLHLQTKPIEGSYIANALYTFLDGIEGIKRDAFPSGHTAIALTVLALSFKYSRRLCHFFMPFVVGLVVSTVYLRYHYVADVIGGIVLFVISLIAGEWYYGWWEKRQRPDYRG